MDADRAEDAFASADVGLRLGTSGLTLDGARRRAPLAFDAYIPTVEAVRSSILRRDFSTCRACGFRANSYQEIVCGGTSARDLEDLVTLCTSCAQCFRLDRVEKMESGRLINLPNVTQQELHWMVREAHVAKASGHAVDRATAALARLAERGSRVSELLGTDSPSELAIRLEQAVDGGGRRSIDRQLEGIRLLPLERLLVRARHRFEYDLFPQLVAYWRSPLGPLADVASTGVLTWLPRLEARLAEA
jgi:hypothetical protein